MLIVNHGMNDGCQAYLEFFVSPELFAFLVPHLEQDINITYHVINKLGDLKTNTKTQGPNAVTWGVFPGKEIVQPTIVEAISFMAWKVGSHNSTHLTHPVETPLTITYSAFQDEAYELGKQWANLYESDSPSHKLISDMMSKLLLVNVVHNDFTLPDAIFEPFRKAGADFAAVKTTPAVNGVGNGHAAN